MKVYFVQLSKYGYVYKGVMIIPYRDRGYVLSISKWEKINSVIKDML